MKTKNLHTLALALFSLILTIGNAFAEDTITLNANNETVKGTIESYDRTKKLLTFASDKGKIPYAMTLVKEYTLAPRPELKTVDDAMDNSEYDKAIGLLKPLVDKYIGLDAAWVGEAAGTMAECYIAQNKAVEADSIFKLIKELYPKSPIGKKGDLVQAKTYIDRNVPNEAITLLEQVEKELPKSPTMSSTYTAMYSELNFIRGLAYEKLNKPKEAYEAYLKTANIYVQPEARSKEARAKADALKKANPSIYID